MIAFDTGICVPEGEATLQLQQAQLISGTRDVQMFPKGTPELPLPAGMLRLPLARGVFHFRPQKIAPATIAALSTQGRENEFLNLGPYCKHDIMLRAAQGETLQCITEYTEDGVEVRAAIGTPSTADEQLKYFNSTKHSPDSQIVIGGFPERVTALFPDL
jgi:hypothetical protein